MQRKYRSSRDRSKLRDMTMGSIDNAKSINNKGQSTLEFAMVVPVIFILVLAASQTGLMVYSMMQMQQASREAARILSTTNDDEMAIKAVKTICGGDAEIVIEPGEKSSRKLGDMVTVRVFGKPGGFTAIINWLTGKRIVLDSKASMRMECGQDGI